MNHTHPSDPTTSQDNGECAQRDGEALPVAPTSTSGVSSARSLPLPSFAPGPAAAGGTALQGRHRLLVRELRRHRLVRQQASASARAAGVRRVDRSPCRRNTAVEPRRGPQSR